MDTTCYNYDGKTWSRRLTTPDNNSFFHSAFGTSIDESLAYFDKQAQFRRLRWATFLSYFENEAMPPRLAKILKKCLYANDKVKQSSDEDKHNFTRYVSDVIAANRHVTLEELPILATLENIQIVMLSSGDELEPVIVKPNPDFLGSYPILKLVEEPKQVVLCVKGNIFSRLESLSENSVSKSSKTHVESTSAKEKTTISKGCSSRYKKGGSAGSKGVQYQVNLLTVVLLNAFKNLRGWRLSTENNEAEKFDDIVLEWSERATFIQSKHKESKKKRITLEELTSTNCKNDEFSLPKYFLSYLLIKEKFSVENVIICTNADIHEKALKILNRQKSYPKSVLHYEGGEYTFYTINDQFLPILKETTKNYYKQNFKNKGIEESGINDENLRGFLDHLQLYFNYPSQNSMEKIIDTLLSSINEISFSEIYPKVMSWFQQIDGVYLTELHAKAMFADIWRDKYCQKLEKYEVSFQRNDLNFQGPNQIFCIPAPFGYLLRVIKVYQAVQNEKTKMLFVKPDDDCDTQKLTVEAFGLPQYVFLIIIWPKIFEESGNCGKLKDILKQYEYKKIIIIAEGQTLLQLGLCNDVVHLDVSVTFETLSSTSQERLVQKENIIFQGEHITLEGLLDVEVTANYGRFLNTEILEKLLRDKEVRVGVPPSDLDEFTSRYYVNRTFKRKFDKSLEDKWDKTNTTSNIQSMDLKDETFSEERIFDVKEKFVLISDTAGMGKSTVLVKLASTIKKIHPYMWVITVVLNEYTTILRDSLRNGNTTLNIEELLNSKNETRLTNHLERSAFYSRRKVVLMLDGIDEVSPDYTSLILNMLKQCRKDSNFEKIFITTRPHMVKELEAILKVKPFVLQPFTNQHQVNFLVSYWTYHLHLKDDTSKEKCRLYAKQLIDNISWTKFGYSTDNHFATLPLHIRMAAEIFQENTSLNEPTNLGGCREYISGNEAVLKLTERINITRLYDLFVEKKRDIFTDKSNPTGNPTANRALMEQFNECLIYHRSLAVEVILGEHKFRYFSNYRQRNIDIETNLLKIGIVQKLNGKLHFVHRTFADYFVAHCLLKELQQNPPKHFQRFLIDTIFVCPQFNVTRVFFDSLLQKAIDSFPSRIFEKYQTIKQENSREFYTLQSTLIHTLAEDDCVTILQLILKSIDFKIVLNKEINIIYLYEGNFNLDTRESIFGNTLNILQHLTTCAGVNITNENFKTPLHIAAQEGSLDMVKVLIEKGANIESRNTFGFTPLHLATAWDHLDIVKFLVKHGSDFNVTNRKGRTLLHSASGNGNLDIVKYLLELGVKAGTRDDEGFTALHTAVRHGQLATVKFLINYGMDYNVTNNYGRTSLHLACGNGHLDIAKFLLELKVDCNAKDHDGCSALHLAACFGHLDVVKFLVHYGLDFNATNNFNRTSLHLASGNDHLDTVKYLLELGVDLSVKDNYENTALQTAAFYGRLDTVKFLIERDVDFNIINDYSCSLLHLATCGGQLETVKYLLQLGVDPTIENEDGFSVLQTAVYSDQLDIVKYLLEYGLDVDILNNKGSTLLHIASEGGHSNTVQFLLEQGVDFNIRSDSGITAIQTAVYFGHLYTVKLLVEYGVDYYVTTNDGSTLLHLASEKGNLDLVKYLIDLLDCNVRDDDDFTALQTATHFGQLDIVKFFVKHGLDFNIVWNRGHTLLHSASCNDHLDLVKYFLGIGVDFNVRDHDGFSAMHLAVSFGNLDIVKLLVEYGVDINATTNFGHTPLHLASSNGHLDIVKFLVALNVDFGIRDGDGFSVLQTAAFFGHLDIVKLFVDLGLDLNVTCSYNRTLLYAASWNGHLDTVKYLLKLDAIDVNARDIDGFTILHVATYFGHLDIVNFLVECGVDYSATCGFNYTLLHLACENDQLETVKYLLDLGVDCNIKDSDGRTALNLAVEFGHLDVVKLLVERGADFNATNNYDRTLLHATCANGFLEMIGFFLEQGIDSKIKDTDGYTALHLAAYFGHDDTVKFLVEYDAYFDVATNNGSTSLHLASEFGHFNTVKLLLELGADFEARDDDGFTSLHSAARYGYLDTVKLLLEYVRDCNVRSSYGYTPLHLASENGHLDTVKFLLGLGVDFEIRDGDGFTVLHTAAYFGRLDTVKLLIEYGLVLNATCNYGRTALHLASMGGHLDTVKFLLGLGVDYSVKNKDRRTALDLATLHGHLDTVNFLIKFGIDF